MTTTLPGTQLFSSLISVADCDVQAFVYAHAAAGIHVRFRGRRLRIAMRLLLIPLLIAILTIIAAMFVAVVPHAATMATG
jgi:hypothetical protein